MQTFKLKQSCNTGTKKKKITNISIQNSACAVQEKHLFNRIQQHPVVHVVL